MRVLPATASASTVPDWEGAEAVLPTLELAIPSAKSVQFLLGEQRYLELLQAGKPQEAIQVLRNKLTPLNFDTPRLHTLTSLVMCTDPDEIREKAGWGGSQGSRQDLLQRMQATISNPTVWCLWHALG